MKNLTETQIENLCNVTSFMEGDRKMPFSKKAIESIIASLKKLYEYEKAEEQGLLLRLPCKIGTPVYVVESECNGDCMCCYGNCETCSDYSTFIEELSFEIEWIDAIGKCVFLTKEEAEAALQKMQEGE